MHTIGCFEALKTNSVICSIMVGLDDIILSEMNQSKKTYIAWFHFYEVSKFIKPMETENIIVVAKGCEEEGLKNSVG